MPNHPLPDFEIPDDLESKYVNFVRISHTAAEFVLDFSLLLPGGGQPSVDSRLIMSPQPPKLFRGAFAETLNATKPSSERLKCPAPIPWPMSFPSQRQPEKKDD